MKKFSFPHSVSSLTLFGSFIFFLYTSSIAPKGVIDHFKVGDVVYSVLKPEDFIKLHGSGWMLMNGAAVPTNADVKKYYTPSTLPDGRGVFVRGMNEGRDANSGDTGGNRIIGGWQGDGLIEHNHFNKVETKAGRQGNGSSANTVAYPQVGSQGFYTERQEGGLKETRPRNIALYTYIKVQEDAL